MKYIKGLDTLRAFAVLVVLVGHWVEEDNFGPVKSSLFKGLFPAPRFGVDLFFVLSGFLITSILLEAYDSGESRMQIIKTFFVRRTLRIFPVYYATLIILLIIGYPHVSEYRWWYLSYTSNFLCFIQQHWPTLAHTWSLAVEEQFYLIWPWLIIFIRPGYRKYIFYLAIAVGIATTVGFRLQSNPPNSFALLLMPVCLHAFGIGALYAFYKRNKSEKGFVKFINLAFPFALLANFYWGFSPDGGHFNYYYRIADCIISIWLIHNVIVVRAGWVKARLVENPILMKIGRVSYGIYLFHYMIPTIYKDSIPRLFGATSNVGAFLLRTPVALSICLIFLFALALSSFEYFEKPILNLKKYFEYGPKAELIVSKAKSSE